MTGKILEQRGHEYNCNLRLFYSIFIASPPCLCLFPDSRTKEYFLLQMDNIVIYDIGLIENPIVLQVVVLKNAQNA